MLYPQASRVPPVSEYFTTQIIGPVKLERVVGIGIPVIKLEAVPVPKVKTVLRCLSMQSRVLE